MQKRLRRLHLSFSASDSLLYVQWDLEPHNVHPASDSNQNHIGKCPGAYPLDQATHSSFASNVFNRKSSPFSEVSPRECVRSAATRMLRIFYSHCSHVHSLSFTLPTCSPSFLWSTYSPLLTLTMKRSLSMYQVQKGG